MKAAHIGAFVCFVAAAVCYALASVPATVGLFVFGLLFEFAAWAQIMWPDDDVQNPRRRD